LLGAAGLGDIGRLFPDDDEQYRNADSMALLATVVARLSDAGMRINNVDATIIAERPKLSPYITGMCERLSGVLGIPMEAVSVKAKTNEGMDAVGEGKGLQVMAVASVQER
jgi:2-C-methyl-D-erythritol 2,4-cyclodiphosphate synthase